MKTIPQFELPAARDCFNLVVERGDDPWRLDREHWEADHRRTEAREYQARMQHTFEQCPGFVGGDAPCSDVDTGRLIIEPGMAGEAMAWLKRRFAVNENLELSDNGLCIEIKPKPRARLSKGERPVKVSFAKPEQFQLGL